MLKDNKYLTRHKKQTSPVHDKQLDLKLILNQS